MAKFSLSAERSRPAIAVTVVSELLPILVLIESDEKSAILARMTPTDSYDLASNYHYLPTYCSF